MTEGEALMAEKVSTVLAEGKRLSETVESLESHETLRSLCGWDVALEPNHSWGRNWK